MISATITFKLGEPAKPFTPRTGESKLWRFVGDDFAAVLDPICHHQARAVKRCQVVEGKVAEEPPQFDRLEVWPVQLGIPDSIVTENPAGVEEMRRKFYDPKPEAEKAAWPFSAWLEQTGKRYLWQKFRTPELERDWLSSAGGTGRRLFLHARKRHFTNPLNVDLRDLERIRFRADFWRHEELTTIYLADCLEDQLTPDEIRTSPGFQARADARDRRQAANLEAAQRLDAQIAARLSDIREVVKPITDLYADPSMAAARVAACKKGVPDTFADWAFRKAHVGKFPSPGIAVKELRGSNIEKGLKAAKIGVSRANYGRWLKIIRSELVKRGLAQPRPKGPAAQRARDYDLGRHAAPQPHEDAEDALQRSENHTGHTARDTRASELGEPPDGE